MSYIGRPGRSLLMAADAGGAGEDLAGYRLLLDLWARENPTKTLKLQVLLLTNAILVSAMSMSGGPVPGNWPLYLIGASFSLVWAFSIGRTVLFQEAWRLKIQELASRYPEDARFHVHETGGIRGKAPLPLRILGSVPSGYYLLGAPVLLFIWWAGTLVYLLF